MVDLFFYLLFILLFLLLPIFIKAEGTFRPDKRVLYISIKWLGIKLLSIRVFLSDDIYISINKNKAKMLSKKKKHGKNSAILPFLFTAIHINDLNVSVYTSGDPSSLSIAISTCLQIINSFIGYLKNHNRLDKSKVLILPCYLNEQATVNFSICVYSCIALVIFSFAYTIWGEKYAKRSDRKHHGQDLRKPETNG